MFHNKPRYCEVTKRDLVLALPKPTRGKKTKMLANIGLYSYGAAALAYSVLALLIFATRSVRPLATPLLIASGITIIWAASIAGSTLLEYPQVKLMQLSEVARNAAWSFVLLKLIGIRMQGSDHVLASSRLGPWLLAGYSLVLIILFAAPAASRALGLPENLYRDLAFASWLAMAVTGLLLLEQIFRNSNEQERWSNKFLCIGLGFIFAYDFFMYAEALLLRQLDTTLWQARGIAVGLAAIFVAIAVRRSDKSSTLQVSRHVAFHSVTLLAAGIYLMLMAIVGYSLKYLGGTWGGVLQISFLSASGLLLLVLLFSGQIRARTRVWLSKNFFSYKYDYRTEWLKFTRTLATGDNRILENIIEALAEFTDSPGGMLWAKAEDEQFHLISTWMMLEPESRQDLLDLPQWMARTEWVVDLQEWRRAPDLYEGLEIPASILCIPRAWLLIPLMFGDNLEGIVLLHESELQKELNWEDRDLLKVAGRQVASHLAQYQASRALVESRQFEAFNRLSAYVVHDLKNILAQQSLIVSNAARHRDNPEFMDDVIDTVGNSVERMTRLMEQMRSGVRGISKEPVALCEMLREVVANRSQSQPAPTLSNCNEKLLVNADKEQLCTVFTHIIQNAQEATQKTGRVEIRLQYLDGRAVVEMEDDGIGMDETFLKERLFTPFDSTKGLTGMGIGAFESREFVRNLGGDIKVSSTPGTGSLFSIVLPCTLENIDSGSQDKEPTK